MSGFTSVFLQLDNKVAGYFANSAIDVSRFLVERLLHFEDSKTIVDYGVYVVAEGVVIAVAQKSFQFFVPVVPGLNEAVGRGLRILTTGFGKVSRVYGVHNGNYTNTLIGDSDILEKVLEADIDKIHRTLDEIDRQAFYDAVDRIIAAKRIYIIGVRSSASLAGFLDYSFRMMFDNVKFIQTTSGSEMFEQVMRIGEGDVMIVISFPRYSKRSINAVELV